MEQVGGSSNGSADACARSDEPPFALTLHRKPKKRASGASSDALERAANERDESEFVSVEVGMREFQRRLAGRKRASTSKDPASRASSAAHAPPKAPRTAQVAQAVAAAGDASRGSKQPAKRARTAKAAGGAPLGAKTTMKAKASAATRAPGKADAKANAKTNAKTAPGQANAPAKPRAKRAPRRPTIAEIRAELLREQQERVETRIQTLHCANCSSVTHAESHVHTHGVQRPLPSPLLLPSVSPQTGTVPVALQELHVANAAAPLGIAQFFAPSVLLGAAPPQTTAVGALEPPAVPYDATHNEFIDDDFDEDMAFVIALDQVERSLTTPTKPPPPPPRTLQAANTVAESIGTGESVASQAGTQQIKSESEPRTLSQAQPAPEMSEVLREFERLKRENELLRQSNVLLQAAAGTSSSPPSAPGAFVTGSFTTPSSFPAAQPSTHSSIERGAAFAQPSVTSFTATAAGSVSAPSMSESQIQQQESTDACPRASKWATHRSHPSSDLATDRHPQRDGRAQPNVAAAVVARGSPTPAEPARRGSEDHSSAGSMSVERRLSAPAADLDRQPECHQQQQADPAPEHRRLDLARDATAVAVRVERADADAGAASCQAREDAHTAAPAVEDTDDSTQSQPADEIEPSQDDGAAENHALGDEVDDEVLEMSQEAPARESTIDRGNYDQYKTVGDDDAENDAEDGVGDGEEKHRQVQSGDVDMVDAEQDPMATFPPGDRVSSGDVGHPMPSTPSLTRDCVPEVMTGDEVKTEPTLTTLVIQGGSSIAGVGSGGVISSRVTESKCETASGAHTVTEDRRMKEEEPPTAVTDAAEARLQSGDAVSTAAQEGDDDHDKQAQASVSKSNESTRPHARAISSSDSETESDNSNAGNDDDESESESEQPGGDGAANGLEAALKAASSRGASSNTATPLKSGNTRASRDAFSLEATGDARVQLGKSSSSHAKLLQKKKKRSRVSDSESDNETAAGAGKRVARPASQLGSGASISSFGGGSGSSTTTTSSIKSTLLWPALDDFYDFILDLSPRRIEVSQKHQTNLRRYSRDAKLPATYATLNEFVSVQIEAIMEELAASLRSAEQSSGQHSPKHLQLTSVSPCGRSHSGQQAVGSGQRPLNSSAIFMESGFSGSMSNTNDFIVTFQPPHGGKKGSSSNFVSGDLVMLRSPRWKSYEMLTFGVVLCNSVVAVGGGSDSRGTGSRGGGGGRDSDLICVLVRTQERDHAHPREDFAALTEMCLANPRSPNWTWRLEYVHNLTTSAREFQAMKSVAFFSPATKRSLLEGKLSSTAAAPKQLKQEHGKSGKAMGAGIAGVSGFVSSAQQPSALPPALLQELEKKYNASQLDAILGCVGDESHVIIQGPPGTGKTKTILGVLSALLDGSGLKKAKESTRIRVGASLTSANGAASAAKPSIRILVAAPSNAAVDELIVRLLSEGVYDGVKRCSYHPRIVRVGRPESLQPLSSSSSSSSSGGSLQTDSKKIKQSKWRKYAKEVEEILLETLVTKHKSAFPSARAARQSIIEGAQVVFCTLSGAGSVAMCDFAQAFDALVIDEAAQAVEASTLIPFKFRPSRVVLVGDHQQLPATVVAKSLLDLGYDRSLFQRFVANGSRVFLLDRQYRMHPDIAAFPSQYFYKGRLVQDAKLRDWTARLYHASWLFAPFVFFDVAAGQQSHVSGSKSLRNLSEVDFVLLLVRKLLAQYPAVDWRKKIGVIAPYKQQVYELSARLERLERDADREPLEVEVNTVDGFQGREKEVIIYSCVRTSSSWKRRGKGTAPLDAFWADERRMNVAITRAKSALWIVGSARLLEQSPAWRALIRAAKDRKCYVLSADAEL